MLHIIKCYYLTQIKIVADDILKALLLFLRENMSWDFMWILCQTDDLHEMQALFS